MESHLELWSGTPRAPPTCCPATAGSSPWATASSTLGSASVASRAGATNLPYREVFKTWTANLPEEWGLHPREPDRSAPLRRPAHELHRKPHYVQGLVLVGDAGGMVSPYNGEGIAPAMKAGRYAASCIAQALSRSHRAGIDRAMSEYPHMLRRRIRRLLPAGPHLRRAHRKPDDHAHLHERRAAHSAPHDARPQTPVGRVREDRGRLRRPTHHNADQGGAPRMTTTTDNREER